jgi:hypothetical protein
VGQRIKESTRQTNNCEAMKMESVQKTRLAQGEVGIITRKQAPTFRESALGQVKKSVETQCAAKPLKEYPGEWRPSPQKVVEIEPTRPSSIAPDGMVRIPAGAFDFRVSKSKVLTTRAWMFNMRGIVHRAVTICTPSQSRASIWTNSR